MHLTFPPTTVVIGGLERALASVLLNNKNLAARRLTSISILCGRQTNLLHLPVMELFTNPDDSHVPCSSATYHSGQEDGVSFWEAVHAGEIVARGGDGVVCELKYVHTGQLVTFKATLQGVSYNSR